MKLQEKLSRLTEIDGFAGAAVLTPDGRVLLKCEPTDINIELISALANNVLRTAEKASRDMGFGRSHFIFMHTDKALILNRCLNEGKNPLGPEPGKCHIHLLLIIDNPDSFGIAKIEIGHVIQALAEHFRSPEVGSATSSHHNDDTHDTTESESTKKSKKELHELLDEKKVGNAFDNLLP
ncbi:MAG: roadblock/LC7 domain-containing protein [Candidatus Electrothrix sp. GW3-4]|uniref:roadblock/LC7 domain-containing protein n=1 Tax=Candidatus Electrothrix sp. GW3-4 TaxID=3126740 RepID=UPI0030D09AE3